MLNVLMPLCVILKRSPCVIRENVTLCYTWKLPSCVISESATLCYTWNCHPLLYIKVSTFLIRITTHPALYAVCHFVCIYINYPILHQTIVPHLLFCVHSNSSLMPLPLHKNTADWLRNKTNTEVLFNIIYKPGYKNKTKLYDVSDFALVYVEW